MRCVEEGGHAVCGEGGGMQCVEGGGHAVCGGRGAHPLSREGGTTAHLGGERVA